MRIIIEKFNAYINDHLLFKLFSCLIVVLVFSLLVTESLYLGRVSRVALTPGAVPQKQATSSEQQARPAPSVLFESYENKTNLPVPPNHLKVYTLKTDYSVDEVEQLGQKLGLIEVKQEGDLVILYNLTDPEKRGWLTFNRETGEFSFQSWGDHRIQITDTRQQAVESFLADLRVIDETVSCNINYQRQKLEAVTFVECHRDWAKVGLPILNFAGILNLPENVNLSTLALGRSGEYAPDDYSIINMSTNDNAKARPNDFNTVTIAITNDNKIMSIESNLRQIESSREIKPDVDLMVPSQALSTFLSHGEELSLTLPAGSGYVDWDKVYPQNLAHSQKAIITDYVLTYLEKPSPEKQINLVPMYTIRGITQLSSGYTVRFAQTLPALKTGLSFLYPLGSFNLASSEQSGQVAGTATAWFSYQEEFCNVGPWYGIWQQQYPNQEYPGQEEEFSQFIKDYYWMQGLSVLSVRRVQRGSIEKSCSDCGCYSAVQLQILIPDTDWKQAEFLGFNQTVEPTPTLTPSPTLGPSPTWAQVITTPTTTPTSIPSPPRTTPISGVTLTPSPHTPLPAQCEIAGGADLILEIPGLGRLVVQSPFTKGVASHTFFFKSASFPVASMEEVHNAFFKAVEEQYIINVSGWLVDNPTIWKPNPPSTIKEMYVIFNTINGISSDSYTCGINPISAAGYLAPFTSDCQPYPATMFNNQRMQQVAQEVAQRLLDGVALRQIDAWASQPDLFPPETLENFQWVFYDLGYRNPDVKDPEKLPYMDCYISGASPSLYFYSQKATPLTVQVNSPLLYTDPPTQGDLWEIIVSPNGLITQDSILRNRLYYEYDKTKITLAESTEGFVIKRGYLETFIEEELGKKLGLTGRERRELIIDVQNTLTETSTSPYIKISLVGSEELEKKIPVFITPQPDVFHRVHLLLTPLNHPVQIVTPNIESLKRGGFTVIELGARLSNNNHF